MAQLVHIRFEDKLREEIKAIVSEGYYGSVSEFVKESVRKNVLAYKREKLVSLMGSGKGEQTQITRKQRLEALKELGLE